MGAFPTVRQEVLPLFISTMEEHGPDYRTITGTGQITGSITWVANYAVYVPIFLPYAYPVNRVWWANGSTASSNVDVGIYDRDGTKIYSTGSTAQSGASALQYVTPGTTFVLDAGSYFIAYACNGTTNRAWGATATWTTLQLRQCGLLGQATAFALPATATFATLANLLLPYCGITRTTTGF
jgi:hypothetical protein